MAWNQVGKFDFYSDDWPAHQPTIEVNSSKKDVEHNLPLSLWLLGKEFLKELGRSRARGLRGHHHLVRVEKAGLRLSTFIILY